MIDFIDLLNSIKEGALESSLLDALSHWRNRPTAELANTIDCLGHALTQDRIDISGNDSTAITNWIQEVSLDPVKLTWLLKPITNVGALHAANRLELLREYPDSDPRFDMALVQWLEAIPYRSSVGKSFYKMVLERAKKIRDVRTIPILENLDSHFQQYFNTVNGRWLAGQTRKVLGPLLKTLKKEASLVESAANVSILLECEAILKTTKPANSIVGREAQLARVLADPTNDDERMVYADLLSEEGMVQGELIVLQMQAKRTKAQNKRVKEILKKHATDFLGPLAAVVLKRDLVFRKGFVAECAVKTANNKTLEDVCQHPLWATVEKLEGPAILASSPALRELRTLDIDGYHHNLEAFCSKGNPRLETLNLYQCYNQERIQALADCTTLPMLRIIRMESFHLETFLTGPLWYQLDLLQLDGYKLIGFQKPSLEEGLKILHTMFNAKGVGPKHIHIQSSTDATFHWNGKTYETVPDGL